MKNANNAFDKVIGAVAIVFGFLVAPLYYWALADVIDYREVMPMVYRMIVPGWGAVNDAIHWAFNLGFFN